MPFLDHLEELRQRLFWCAGAILLGMIAAFALLSKVPIIKVLAAPVKPYLRGSELIYTHPGAALTILMQASFVVGLLLASPIIVFQLWRFVSPAMYRREKRIIVPTIIAALTLFLTGVVIAFEFVLPLVLRFLFVDVNMEGIQPMIAANEYFSFAIFLCVAFGLVFELPVLILILAALGVVTPQRLSSWRRFAVVAAFIVGAFIAPDPSSMFMLAIPFYLLYEIGIGVAFFVHRAKQRKEAREAAERELEERSRDEGPRGLGAPA